MNPCLGGCNEETIKFLVLYHDISNIEEANIVGTIMDKYKNFVGYKKFYSESIQLAVHSGLQTMKAAENKCTKAITTVPIKRELKAAYMIFTLYVYIHAFVRLIA